MPESTPLDSHQDIPVYHTEDWFYEGFEIGKKNHSVKRIMLEGEAMMFNNVVLYCEHLQTVKYKNQKS